MDASSYEAFQCRKCRGFGDSHYSLVCGSGIGVGGAVASVKGGVVGMNLRCFLVRNPIIPSEKPPERQNMMKRACSRILDKKRSLVAILTNVKMPVYLRGLIS